MTLGQRIREQRLRCGLSQEQVAEAVGVSRQAVAKWENDQSAPATGNLFRLAALFGTTVDLLLPVQEGKGTDSTRQVNIPYRKPAGFQRQTCGRPSFWRNWRLALGVLAAYLVVYLAGRLSSIDWQAQSFTGWLWGMSPQQLPYLYGWLLHQKLFWVSLGVSLVSALLGRGRFAFASWAGFALGWGLGEVCGADPAGAPYGHGHYGWAIWGGIFLLSILWGILLERLPRGRLWRMRGFWLRCGLYLAACLGVILAVRAGIPPSYGG